jgi:hypothetical protein
MMNTRGAVAACLLGAALVGCGASTDPEADPAAPSPTGSTTAPPPGPTSAAPSVPPADPEALALAEQYLAAVVSADHDTSYGLLSDTAQQSVSLEAYASAREGRAGSARNLVLYELTGVDGDGGLLTVTGTGRVADGTRVELSLPLRRTDQGLRVDTVPTGY